MVTSTTAPGRSPGTRRSRNTRPAGERPPLRRTRRGIRTTPRRGTDATSGPTLITVDDVPGDIGMTRLIDAGLIVPLDSSCGYLRDQADTVFGRATIVERMVPFGSIAAGLLAAWVWLGGAFPHRLDIISNSRYRTLIYERQVTVYSRRTTPDHVMRIGKLSVTSPLRTICDIACMDRDGKSQIDAESLMAQLMDVYEVTVGQCRQTLWENPRWPNHSEGIQLLIQMKDRTA